MGRGSAGRWRKCNKVDFTTESTEDTEKKGKSERV
jgi:hypothetical protein